MKKTWPAREKEWTAALGISTRVDTHLSLPDYLESGLRLVFIGLNPGLYSAQRGHYFARPTNRFWRAFSASRLGTDARTRLGEEYLAAADDSKLSQLGIGFTDVVKTATSSASELGVDDFRRWAPVLLIKLRRYQPLVACFHGVMAYRGFLRHGLGIQRERVELGEQDVRVESTRIFVVPNPSPANARFNFGQQTECYDRLGDFLEQVSAKRPNA